MLNFTDEEMNRKSLSGFPHTTKWHALDPDMSPEIVPDNYFECQTPMIPDNYQTWIEIKQKFIHTFECDGFYSIVMNESDVLCVFVLVIYLFFYYFC